MAKFKVGDKVKIIQRKKNNHSGTEPGWNEPNGNVSEIGYVTKIQQTYLIHRNKDEIGYFGWFDEDDLELVSEKVSTTPYVEGKWYGCKDWNNKHDYVKFDYIYSDKTRIYFTECIDNTEYRQINDWWGIKEKELFEADMSIISQFLPDGHPDKIYSKEIDMQAIQEEAKRRFPIGCEFIPVDSYKTHTLIEDYCTYEIHGKYIWAHNGYGHLYENGKWAELVSLPIDTSEPEKTCFQKGDYIVTLINDGNCGKINYCSKQRKDLFYLSPVIDTKGSVINGNSNFDIGDKSFTKWRYATPEEAAEYERIGKPYDVTTLQKKKEQSIPEYVECVRGLNNATVGKIYKVIDASYCESNSPTQRYSWQTPDYKPSTKEAYEAQFVSKELTKEEWEPGTYAVGVKGNFGVYEGSKNLIPIGHIYTIKENKTVEVILEGEKFWVYKENLKWFATREEAETFSKTLLKTEESPLEICRKRYKKGMVVQSAEDSGMYSGTFTINVDPEKFTKTGDSVYYFRSEGFLYLEGKYAKILSYPGEKSKLENSKWPSDLIVEERINTSSIKKETFIENVQSVNVMLRTKKKSIKF